MPLPLLVLPSLVSCTGNALSLDPVFSTSPHSDPGLPLLLSYGTALLRQHCPVQPAPLALNVGDPSS